MCVAPLAVSKVSSEETRLHGVRLVVLSVRVMTPRISVRRPVAPTLGNSNEEEKIWPVPAVNDTGVPMAVPAALRNEIVPVQAAAVPFDELAAVFTTLICAVSELASPMGGEVSEWVFVVEVGCVWANSAPAHPKTTMHSSCRENVMVRGRFPGKRRCSRAQSFTKP